MLLLRVSQLKSSALPQKLARTAAILTVGLAPLFIASPAFAHPSASHAIPTNPIEAFFSGITHPLTGFDHLAFVVALGLLASLVNRRSAAIPAVFFLTVIAGASLHLIGTHLPALEVVISASVLGLGLILAWQRQPNLALVVSCAAIFGLFHGYAYGEFVVGASAGLLVTYYIGLTLAQVALGLLAYASGQLLRDRSSEEAPYLSLRFAGFAICGIGMTLLSSFFSV
ncbi:MAG: HupE/UreJ family protein [Cyanobacteriota bacterium]|nr:HupE/UreJ family protein [Cyanobacteriota bacterium]